MKKYLIWLLVLLVSISFSTVSFAGKRGGGPKKNDEYYRKDGNLYKKNRTQKSPQYYGHGYRHRYYGKRHYHPRHYRGHWRSWRAWEDYRRHHHREYRRGHYYRKNNQLYFEFETDEGRFVFSIGR